MPCTGVLDIQFQCQKKAEWEWPMKATVATLPEYIQKLYGPGVKC